MSFTNSSNRKNPGGGPMSSFLYGSIGIGLCLAGILCLSDTVEAWTAAFAFCALGLVYTWLLEWEEKDVQQKK